jgi:hypothetical protein
VELTLTQYRMTVTNRFSWAQLKRLVRHCTAALLVLVLVIPETTLKAAAQQADPALDGSVVERDDGSLFVLKGGALYPIEPLRLTEADIDALPLGSPIASINQLASPEATVGPSASGVDVVPPAAATAPGTLLYQADWTDRSAEWALPAGWSISEGMLTYVAAGRDASDIVSPYQPPTVDYALEVQVRALKYQPPIGGQAGFGVFGRGDGRGDIRAGIFDTGRTAGIVSLGASLSLRRPFDPATLWHTYRLEAKGNQVQLSVDGVVWDEGALNPLFQYTTPNGRLAGLFVQAAEVNFRSFKILAL